MRHILNAILFFTFCLISCQPQEIALERDPQIKVVKEKNGGGMTYGISPLGDGAGTVVVQQGDRIQVEGFNLDLLGSITIDGVEAEISDVTKSSLSFIVPELDLEQSDFAHQTLLEAFGLNSEEPFFKIDFYITVPITDAMIEGFSPAEGSYGTLLSITGRNLEQLTAISVAGNNIPADNFLEHSASRVKIALPALTGETAESQCEIKAIWPGSTLAVTDDESPFTYRRPIIQSLAPAEAVCLAEEFTITGVNLDLIKAYHWGEYEFIITTGDPSDQVVLKVPSNIPTSNPVVQTKDLIADWGSPAVEIVAIKDLKIDTTPTGIAAPELSSIQDEQNTIYSRLYLGHTIVVNGSNMASVEAFEIDGVRADVIDGSVSDVQAKFIMPSSISGDAVRQVTIKAIYGGGNEANFGTISVCPFYCVKGLKIGIGSNSNSTYTDDGRNYAFVILNEGRVISAQEWVEENVDPYANGKSSNEVIAAQNRCKTGKETEYNSVAPYTLLTASSANKLAFQCPTNSASQLKNHRYPGSTGVSTTFGTPMIYFAVLPTSNYCTSIIAGNQTSIYDESLPMPGKAAPAFGANDNLFAGSVLMWQHLNYAHASTTGGKPTSMSQVKQLGYLVITDVTCANADGTAVADRAGFVFFDCYWSNPL